MLKWLKWFFSKKVKVVINNNYTEALHGLRNNRAIVGRSMTIVIKSDDGFVLDFVRVYRKSVSDKNEIDCIKIINDTAIIIYTPQREDERIIVQASARMIGPGDSFEQPAIYEIRCDEFQYTIPKQGGHVYINPYVLKTEFTTEGRTESIINYDPNEFTIEVTCPQIESGDWVLNENKLMASYNKTENQIVGELTITYNSKSESNQIYQE